MGRAEDLSGAHAIDALPADAVIGATSAGLLAIPHLGCFLGSRPTQKAGAGSAIFAGWGLKQSGVAARQMAERHGRPAVILEDGFIRSVGLGKAGAAAVSLVLDDSGIYYDASRTSRIERLLSASGDDSPSFRESAAAALGRWRSSGLSKYNIGSDEPPEAAAGKIVLVDQVMGDHSIAGAGATIATFETMLSTALGRYGADRLVVRSHPDVVAGKAKSCLSAAALRHGISIMADGASPPALLAAAAGIWTVSSALGFEAILRGTPVSTFGMPFYAGWGLTEDCAEGVLADAARRRRGVRLDVTGLFGASFLRYARYADPVLQAETDFDGAVSRLLDWRERDRAAGRGRYVAFGFSRWKRRASAAILGGTGRQVIFAGSATAWRARRAIFRDGDQALAWGMKERPGFLRELESRGIPIRRVEDGFLRSVGLGSDLLSPGSLVIDGRHLYFDATGPSAIETLLARGDIPADVIERAAVLRTMITARGMTKYNLGGEAINLAASAGGRRIVLVAGQVPGDAAMRHGMPAVRSNLELVRAVRSTKPHDFIVYKEHPDLVAGNRRGATPPGRLSGIADLVLTSGDLGQLYAGIDELHVVSSLAGFEALLRGVAVVTWGMPFYAGWGLTTDHVQPLRPRRRVELDELVAAALILYPRYADALTLTPCGPEDFLRALERQRSMPGRLPRKGILPRLGRFIRSLLPRNDI
jgi:capsular polysaccharide export protein